MMMLEVPDKKHNSQFIASTYPHAQGYKPAVGFLDLRLPIASAGAAIKTEGTDPKLQMISSELKRPKG